MLVGWKCWNFLLYQIALQRTFLPEQNNKPIQVALRLAVVIMAPWQELLNMSIIVFHTIVLPCSQTLTLFQNRKAGKLLSYEHDITSEWKIFSSLFNQLHVQHLVYPWCYKFPWPFFTNLYCKQQKALWGLGAHLIVYPIRWAHVNNGEITSVNKVVR